MGRYSRALEVRVFGAMLALFTLAPAVRAQDSSQGATQVLPAIVVSPTTIPTPVDQVASSITVITAEDIQRQHLRTVPDALRAVPGLNVVQSGGPGGQTAVFIRGTNSNHVKVFVDGIDVGDTTTPNGAYDFAHLLTGDIAQIEVLRGPQSGLYGSDAIGGVISITTKKGEGPPKVTASFEAGSFKTFNQTVRAERLAGCLQLRLQRRAFPRRLGAGDAARPARSGRGAQQRQLRQLDLLDAARRGPVRQPRGQPDRPLHRSQTRLDRRRCCQFPSK